jgi:ribosomal protein S18 acetylase RimI-like enzyme
LRVIFRIVHILVYGIIESQLRGGLKMRIEQAEAANIKEIAALFMIGFRDSVLHYCKGRVPYPQAMEDVFSLVFQAEPEAAFVAKNDDGKVVGYCFAPALLSGIWIKAVTGGHILKWCWRWLSGQYGFGLHPVKVICINKLAFLCSAAKPDVRADARILSIMVDENYRGQGIAGKLLERALTYFHSCGVRQVRLEVRPGNGAAIRVYEKFGFVPGGCTQDSQGKWLIMMKEMGNLS